MKKKSGFINSELIRLSCEWAHYVSECFTLSRWRSFTFSVASDGPHFFPSMSPRSMVHPLTSWEWHRTLTYNCICAQRLHSRNVLALCYIGINHLWSIGWLGFFLVLLEKKSFCLVWLIKFWSGWKSTGCLLRWIFTEGQFHVSTENGQKEKGQLHQPTPVAFETIDPKRTRS